MRRIVRLWWPYVLWGGVFLLLHDVLLAAHVYTDDQAVAGVLGKSYLAHYLGWSNILKHLKLVPFMLDGSEGIAGAFWFLRTLFISSCLYLLCDYAVLVVNKLSKLNLSRMIVLTCFAVISLIIARYLHPGRAWSMVRWIGGWTTFTAYALIHLGVMVRYYQLELSRFRIRSLMMIFVVCVVFLITQIFWPSGGLSIHRYSSISRLVLCAIVGWFMLEAGARQLTKCGYGKILAYIGAHTMPILIFHLLSFKIVSAVGVWWLGMSPHLIAAFPCTFHGLFWCLAYTIVGVAVPLTLNFLFKVASETIRKTRDV